MVQHHSKQETDETNALLEEGTVNLNGTKVGNAPQTSFGFGFKYNVIGGLTVDADYNIYTDLYGFVDAEDVIDAARWCSLPSRASTSIQCFRCWNYLQI